MVRGPDEQTIALLREHLQYIRAKFAPEKILLFGSRARGDHLIESDIDILIVSDKFEGMGWRERIITAFSDWDKQQMLEPLCYTPAEFEKKKRQIGIVKQAIEEGIEL
jgi:predicted nucleotidyltransferase